MYETTFKKDGDILHVHIAGKRTREAVAAASKEIMEVCLAERTPKLLIDVRELLGSLSVVDDYELPKAFHDLPPHGGRLKASAIVDRPDNDAHFAFFEDVARNQGFNLRIFASTTAALKWLDEQGDSQPQTKRR